MLCRPLSRFLAALAVTALSPLAAHAAAPVYDAIIVFGDSYNDVGNIYAIAAAHGVSYPPKPYYAGRFSNGPLWIEDVAGSLKLPLTPSVLGGTDWAEGGAELLQTVTIDGLPIPSVEDQVAEYLASTGGKADPHALYVIEGGGNDILDAATPDPALGAKIGAALNGMVHDLAEAGARSFLLPDLIDVGQLPAAAAAGSAAEAYATAMATEANSKLIGCPGSFVFGIRVYRIPTFQVFHDIVETHTHFGFANVSTPCLSATLVACKNPDHTLWWDAEHPSEFGHIAFAVMVESRLDEY